MSLTNIYVWREVCRAYFPLESFLSTIDMADDAIICFDPMGGDPTEHLAWTIANRYSQVRPLPFTWPHKSHMGSAIGEASNFALSHVKTDLVCNIQADEVWYPELTKWVKTHKDTLAYFSIVRFAFLHLRYNAQELQKNAGYQVAEKMARVKPELRFAPDAWRFETEAETSLTCPESNEYPIVHLHHFFRGGVISQLANNVWLFGDQNSIDEHDRFVTDGMLLADPMWDKRTSPYSLPDLVLPHLGQYSYHINWDLLG